MAANRPRGAYPTSYYYTTEPPFCICVSSVNFIGLFLYFTGYEPTLVTVTLSIHL